MALHLLCHNCGWKESAHLYPGLLTVDEQRRRDQPLEGYPLPLRRCPGYRPSRVEVAEVLKIQRDIEQLIPG